MSDIVIGMGSLILVQMLRFHGSRGQTALIICQRQGEYALLAGQAYSHL